MNDIKKGDIVAVCYDSHWGRAQKGEVIDLYNPRSIKKKRQKRNAGRGKFIDDYIVVKFTPWNADEIGDIEIKARRNKHGFYEFYLSGEENGEQGILRWLGQKEGDYYAVVSLEMMNENDFHPEWQYDEPRCWDSAIY